MRNSHYRKGLIAGENGSDYLNGVWKDEAAGTTAAAETGRSALDFSCPHSTPVCRISFQAQGRCANMSRAGPALGAHTPKLGAQKRECGVAGHAVFDGFGIRNITAGVRNSGNVVTQYNPGRPHRENRHLR